MTRYLYVGSATQVDKHHPEEGIFVFKIDPSSGELTKLHAYNSGPNPSFLAIHREKHLLFCVNETLDGSATSFAINPENGSLSFISRVKVKGDLPCYVSVDTRCQYLLVANYGSGSLSVIPVSDDGILGNCEQMVQHEGFAANPSGTLACYDSALGLMGLVHIPGNEGVLPVGVNLERQEHPHAHSIIADPTERFALAADLGMDRVWAYRLENGRLMLNLPEDVESSGKRSRAGSVKEWFEDGWTYPNSNMIPLTEKIKGCDRPMAGHNLKPGSGPRHIAFHPNGRVLYISNELDSTVAAFSWNGNLGCLMPIQVCTTLPESYTGVNYPAHLALTPDGRFLIVSNRGHNSLAVFAVAESSGFLNPVGHYSTGGNWPRNFCIDPQGHYLYVANQESGSVVVYSIDIESGALTPTGESIAVPKPFFVTVFEEDYS